MQYKFRGMRKDNGQWVYGLLVMGVFNDTMIQVRENGFCHTIVVIPETVGIWTGLKDKNGKEVYEGDLYSTEECGPNYKVMFVAGAFVGGTSEHPDDCMPLGWDVNEDVIEPDLPNWFEVVGNIHDVNPASGQSGINNMLLDPNEKQATEEVKAEGQEIAAVEQEAQEQAMESEKGSEG